MSEVSMGPAEPIVSAHFEDREQQSEASHIGMWLFLSQEIMFFTGLFVAYGVYRYKFPEAFHEGSAQLNFYIGTVNTTVLLASSVTMAMCVYCTQTGKWKGQVAYLCATLGLGLTFLVIKGFEWKQKWDHGLIPSIHWQPHGLEHPVHDELFFSLYFIMTGMHAFHMVIGFGIGAVFVYLCWVKKEYGPNKYLPIEYFGLYWHFVDIVWVFLFPMMYLISQ